jgi:hypothetical protein
MGGSFRRKCTSAGLSHSPGYASPRAYRGRCPGEGEASVDDEGPYFSRLAAAFVLDTHRAGGSVDLPSGLAWRPCDELSPKEQARVIGLGRVGGLRLHRFKRTMGLRRVERVR